VESSDNTAAKVFIYKPGSHNPFYLEGEGVVANNEVILPVSKFKILVSEISVP
jgi:hypothetical protein